MLSPSLKECSCKNKNPEELLEEGGNCICSDCNCHYYKRNDIRELGERGILVIGTSILLYSLYLFCCEKHLYHLSI